jgi:carbohydrate-selective porin OprB
MNLRIIAAALGAAALAIPAAAAADPGHGKAKPKKAAKAVTYVFKGTFTAPGTVAVTSGNAHVRKGGYVGQSVTFDLATAKIVGVDTNADLKVDVADVADGDRVLVQARVTKGTKYAAAAEDEAAAAIVARKLVDKTGEAADEVE